MPQSTRNLSHVGPALRAHPVCAHTRLCHVAGAACAWGTMAYYPKLAKRLAILNVPHPERFAASLSTPQQLLKSWYACPAQSPAAEEEEEEEILE